MRTPAPAGDRAHTSDDLDPVVEGAAYDLPATTAEQIWLVVAGEATDAAGELDLDRAVARFHQVAGRVAARRGQLATAPGRVSLLAAETWGRDPAAEVFRRGLPGRGSRVELERLRWARRLRAPQPRATETDAAPSGPPQLRVVRGGAGAPLPADIADDLVPTLGAAAHRARIHLGPDAEQLAAAHGAHAVTFGEDVYFGRGGWQPDTAGGRHLIAHEVAHVAQSLRGEPVRAAAKKLDGSSHGAGEAEADLAVAVDVTKISGGYLKGDLTAEIGAGGTTLGGDVTVVKGPLKGVVEKIKVSYNLKTKELTGQFVLAVDKLSALLPRGVSARGNVTIDLKKSPNGVAFAAASAVDVRIESLLGGKVKDLHFGDGYGATFLPDGDYRLGAVQVVFAEGTTLTVDSKTGLTGALVGSVQIGSLPTLDLEVRRGAKGLDVHVATTIALEDLHPKLGGTVHVAYRKDEHGGRLAFVADGPRLKDLPHGDLLATLEGETDGKEITGKLTAKRGAQFEYQNVKGTLHRGELALLPGKRLEGQLEGSVVASVGTGHFALGFHDGALTWNAKGKVNLAPLTGNVLVGEVEAELGTGADTTFASQGITFGPAALRGLTITELRGNLTRKTFAMSVDGTSLARRVQGQIPGLDITIDGATASLAYDGADGVKLDGDVHGHATVKAKNGRELASGSFQLTVAKNQFGGELRVDRFEISPYLKGHGLVIDLRAGIKSGTVEFEMPNLAKGRVDGIVLDLAHRQYGFDAHVDFDGTQRLIAGTQLHVKLADGVLTGDATFKNEYVSGALSLTTGRGETAFHGHLDKKLGGLGKLGENFLGAELSYTKAEGLAAKGGFSLAGLSNLLGNDSKIELSYARGTLAVDGTLQAGPLEHVVYTGEHQLRLHWQQGGALSVRGQIDATVANLAQVSLKVAAGPTAPGTGQADLDPTAPRFYLSGRITSVGLQTYFPTVGFSEPTAAVHVENGADGRWSFRVDDLSTHIHRINGLDHADVALTASYVKGKGLTATADVRALRWKQFTVRGSFGIKDNHVEPAHLAMEAAFPGVKLTGGVDVTRSELGGLSWKTHVDAVPTEGGPLAWVKSGTLDATMDKGTLKDVTGTLQLKPPSFLPVEKPEITIGYHDGHVVGTLTTEFASPLHKTAKGTLTLTIGGPKRFEAEIRLPAKLPGMKEAHVSGRVTANGHVEIGAVLEPDGLPFIKRARVAITYDHGAFVVGGFLTLAPTDDYQLELGVEYDITNKQFRIKGLEPKHDDQAKDEPLATVKKDKHFPSIPLFGIGIANIALTMRLGFGVSINKPFFTFDNPKLVGGLEALDHGQMPAIEFGGRVGIGAEMFVEFGVGIAGQIQLLIASAELGIEGVLRAGLTMNLQSDIHGTFEHGKPLELTIDPSVSAALKLTASLNAFLFAEVLWWTIIDKKWPLASIDLADIPLGEFHPFDPFRLKLGGGRGASIETPSLKDDQSAMTDGAKKAAQTAGDDTAQQETKDKVRPVLARIRQVARRFESPPDWQGKGMTIAPVEFDSWYGIDQDKWDTYREVADNAEAMVPEEACKTPTEKLSKAVAVLSKLNPFLAGMLVLQWQRAQIAAQGFNPDTGEDVVAKQKELEALVANDYATALIAWQTAVDAQAQAHGKAVEKQGADFAAAEQQLATRTESTNQTLASDTQRAQRELQAQQDKLKQAQGQAQAPTTVAPPPPRPVAPPAPKLAKPAPIPQPAPIPEPKAPLPVPAITLPALPADPGASPPAAGRVPPAKPPRAVPAPVIAPPSPGPAPSSRAAATGSKSAVSRGGGGSGGGAKPTTAVPKPTTGAGGTGAPGPAVVAGPQGIIVQDQSLERRRASLGAGAPTPGKAPAPATTSPATTPTTVPSKPSNTDAAKPSAPDATVQTVVAAGKAQEDQRKQRVDASAAAYAHKTDGEKQAAAAAEAKLKQAQTATAGATPATPTTTEPAGVPKTATAKADDAAHSGATVASPTPEVSPVPTSLIETHPATIAHPTPELERAIATAPSGHVLYQSAVTNPAEVTRALLANHRDAHLEAGKLSLPPVPDAEAKHVTSLEQLGRFLAAALGVSKLTLEKGTTVVVRGHINPDVVVSRIDMLSDAELDARGRALRAKADEEMALNKAETQALTAAVFARPEYLHQGHLVVGAGFAAVQNVATHPNRSTIIGVGFPEPWFQRGTLAMGQAPHILDVSGFVTRPEAYRASADERRQKYLRSDDFGRSIAQTQHLLGFRVAEGWMAGFECVHDLQADRRQDWREPALPYRLTLTNGDRHTKVYCQAIDIASGPGPGRTLAPEQLNATDAGTIKRMQPARPYQINATGGDYTTVPRGGTVVVYGCSPSGAWAAQFARHAGASVVYWVGAPDHMPMVAPTEADIVNGVKIPGTGGPVKGTPWTRESVDRHRALGPNGPWMGTYIGDRNIQIINALPRGHTGAPGGRFESTLITAVPIPDAAAPAPTVAGPNAADAGPGAPALTVTFGGAPGSVLAHQIVVCAGVDTELEHGLAPTLRNVPDQPNRDATGKPNAARFAYIPIFQHVSREQVLTANDRGGWWRIHSNPAVTGPLLGFEDRHGGARVLGAAAYNVYRVLAGDEAEVIKTIMNFYKDQLPVEMQTTDGIALAGETIAAANTRASGTERPPIIANQQPTDRAHLVNINTAFLHDLLRVPAFQSAPRTPFPGFDGTTIAELIIAVRSGRCGVVIREVDDEASRQQGRTVIRNKIDGFRGVKDLSRYKIIDAFALAPFAQWLRV